jgi:hypothetical protein
MNLIGSAAVISAIHDGWTFSAFLVLLLVSLHIKKRR